MDRAVTLSAFFDLTEEEQIAKLQIFAEELLRENGWSNFTVESVNFGFNATFKVVADSQEQYALRININSTRTLKNTEAEIAWTRELSKQLNNQLIVESNSSLDEAENQQLSEVIAPSAQVASPVPFTGHTYIVQKFHPEINRELSCVLYGWLPGEGFPDEPSEEQLIAMGKAMATLHNLSAPSDNLSSPSSNEATTTVSLPYLSHPFWEIADFLFSSHSSLTESEQNALRPAFHKVVSVIDDFYAKTSPQLIHADMHGGNLLWNDGSLSIIDFDDCGIGLPIQDISVALYYFDTPDQDAAFLSGYSSVRPLPEYSPEQMSALLLHRRFMLLNYLCETNNAEHRAMLPEYLIESIRRAQKFMEL